MLNGELRTECICGATWTHPADRSKEEIDKIFAAHVDYFKHKPTTIL